jgi:hypothetical protein
MAYRGYAFLSMSRTTAAADIFKIGNTEMARVLTMVEGVCPSALSRKVRKSNRRIDAAAAATCLRNVLPCWKAANRH